MTTYKLSRCAGSRTCWCATFGDDNFAAGTDYNLGRLIEVIWEHRRRNGGGATFILDITDDAEEAALAQRRQTERGRLERETKDAQRRIRDNKKRITELSQ